MVGLETCGFEGPSRRRDLHGQDASELSDHGTRSLRHLLGREALELAPACELLTDL
jgi:hypothetical protein